ncbi:hypothetical protein Back11_39610 [Paenibacillus baekrokdamisoli]|uniref:Uncharacterized protein n=1 Tax=Paenibacillus baekrokdamisoli TaxID=1712516 RepID=A0A3G9IVV0_9BACL|nr:hypothetical protein [Paenibacillus baekrokdamisoli]MBB3068342.1 hypothetical protein [Paenibacillus baekrokdamisoli]BBH22616.1 hypothetical protein Back11_39610 [Paenibacillus baekrokdamisoli]
MLSNKDLYWVNEDHKQNFHRCIAQFKYHNSAAHPEIFKCFLLKAQLSGPFDWYFERLEVTTEVDSDIDSFAKGDTSPLTGQTTALVRLALNLWNG